MCDGIRRSSLGAGVGSLVLLIVTTMLVAAATAGSGPFPELTRQVDRVDPADKSVGGTIEVVVGYGGEVWTAGAAGWIDLEYPGTEDLYDVDAAGLSEVWVSGALGVRRYNGDTWGSLEELDEPMNGVIVRDDGVVACGANGRVMLRRDGIWTDLTDGTANDLYAIWGTSADDFWVCGEGGRIQHYVDGESTTIGSGTVQNLLGVWGAPGVGPYFVGNNGTILRWREGAIEPMTSGVTDGLIAVDGTGVDNVWAVGSPAVALRYDGVSWQNQTAPGALALNDVSALPSGLAKVVDANGNLRTYGPDGWITDGNGPDIFLSGMVSVPDLPNDRWWDGFARPERGGAGLAQGSSPGSVYSIETFDGELVVLGFFDQAGETPANGLATFDGETWTPLGDIQPADYGRTVVEFQGLITAVGWVDDVLGVYQWDGGGWQSLGFPGSGGSVRVMRALTIGATQRLFLAGSFSHPDAPDDGAVFEYLPGSGAWEPVGAGLNGDTVYYGMDTYAGDLFVCGGGAGSPPRGLAYRLEGAEATNTWENVLDTTSYLAIVLLNHQSALYLGAGLNANIDALLRYNPAGGPTWVPQGAIIPDSDSYIYDLRSWGDRILLAGFFPSIGDEPTRHVAVWEDGEITPLGTGVGRPGTFSDWAVTTAALGEDLYFGGQLLHAGGLESWGLTRWSTAAGVEGPPSADVSIPSTLVEGQDFVASCDVSAYQTVRAVTFSHRALDRDAYQHVPMMPSAKADGVWEATIDGADVSPFGVQYFVTVQTDQYTVTQPPNPAVQASFVGIQVNNAEWTAPLPLQYELMGVPFAPAGTMAQILEDDLNAYDPEVWRMERWDPAAEVYRPYDHPIDPIVPGRGYWLIQRNPVPIDISGATTSTAGGHDITLQNGWNMIAAPYLFPVAWSSVTPALPPAVEPELIGRANDEYVTETVLEPWRGYWVRNNGATPVTINIPATPTSKAAEPAPDPRDLAGCEWTVAIRASQDERDDLPKVVGALAEGGEAPGDLHQPPGLDHDLMVWIERTAGDRTERLRRDLREFEGGAVWDLVIRPADAPAAHPTLAFDGLADVPAALEVALATPGGVIDLRAAGGQWTAPVAGETRVRLVVGDPELAQEAAATLPQPYALLPNYPNPFNPATHVVFTTPRDGRVTVELYDVKGRRVRTLVDEVRAGGRHEVLWDGTDDGGRSLASGVYFARMRAGDFGQTRKLTLVR